jgi:RluA family pseudouridine synthase
VKSYPESIILWSDPDLLVVDKPAGLLALPDGYDPKKPYLASLLEPEFGQLWVVHRLDKETSGVIALARSAEAHRELNRQFAERQIVKTYHALTLGSPSWDERDVDQPLRSNVGRRHRSVVDPRDGKPSYTKFRVMERFKDYALLEARPKTGRTHQIRAHLRGQNLPILADPLYGIGEPLYLSAFKKGYRKGKRPEQPLNRLGLHAHSLTFQHPTTLEQLRIEAPYPKDFASTLRQLRKYGT